MTIVANPITQRKLEDTSPGTDRNPLLLLLEKLVLLIEKLWREEGKTKASMEPDTQRQTALRNVHQSLAELFEFESSSGQVFP